MKGNRRKKTKKVLPSKPRKGKKIDFLKKQKTTQDKFFDIYKNRTRKGLYEGDKGELKVKRKYKKQFADEIGLDGQTLTHAVKYGFDIDKLFSRIDKKKIPGKVKGVLKRKVRSAEKRIIKIHNEKKKETNPKTGRKISTPKFSKSKTVSPDIRPEDFTIELFPSMGKFPRRKKNQQFYFRAGLYMKFKGGYIINNFPVSHYDFKGYPEGYITMFEKVYDVVNTPHREVSRLLFFRFNYFDVQLLNI